MSDTSTLPPPAQAAALPPPDGAQPSTSYAEPTPPAATQAETALAREENARTVLRGDAAAPNSLDQARHAGLKQQQEIEAQFDPETGELLDEDPLTVSDTEDAASESETAAAGAAEPPVGDRTEAARQKEQEGENGAEDDTEADRGKRIRIRRDSLSDRDFAILTLAKEKRLSFADAERQLFGGAESPSAAAAEDAPSQLPGVAGDAPAARPPVPTVAGITEQISALRAERDAATEANDGRLVNRLNDQLADLRDALYEARQGEAAQREEAQQKARMRYATVETEAIHRAAELFPDAKVAGSELHEVMKAKAASLRKQDPAYFENPRWPILLTVETAATLGVAPKGKPAPAPESAPVAVTPRKVTRPAPAPAPGSATSASQLHSESALRAELKAATASRDVDAIKLVMRKIQAG